jgi:hypothetical protein
MCKLGCMLRQARTLWIRSSDISLTEKFIKYCEEKTVTHSTYCVRVHAREPVCVCGSVGYVVDGNVHQQRCQTSNPTGYTLHLCFL